MPCSVHCSYTAAYAVYLQYTLPASGSVPAVYVQPTLQLHWIYTACTLHFGLGKNNQRGAFAWRTVAKVLLYFITPETAILIQGVCFKSSLSQTK